MDSPFHGTEMNFPKQRSMLIFSLIFAASVNAATNSNTCLAQIPQLKICLGLAPSSPTCCAAVKAFQNSRCFCNSLALALLGLSDASRIASITNTCGAGVPNCNGFATKTYNGGTCSLSDVDMDKARFFASYQFSNQLLSLGSQTTSCFNYPAFFGALSASLNPGVTAYAGQGLGTYSGINAVAEYLSLLSPVVNKGFVKLTEAPPALASPASYISPAGDSVTAGKNVINRYVNNMYSRNDLDYLENTLVFRGCDTKASTVSIPAVSALFPGKATGVISLAETLFLTANTEKFYRTVNGVSVYPAMMGYKSICRQHERFCTGSNSQFSSITDCENFYIDLLKNKPATPCGTAALVSGNNVACRAKHQFMVQINAAEHCPHLGRNSAACNNLRCDNPGPANAVNLALSTSLQDALFRTNSVLMANFANNNQWVYSNYC